MRSTRVQKSPVRTEGSFPLEPPDVAWPPDRASGSTSPLVTVWATSSRSACSAITLPSCSSVSKATNLARLCARVEAVFDIDRSGDFLRHERHFGAYGTVSPH